MHLQNSAHKTINLLHCAESSETLFLPDTINEWNKLDPEIKKIVSYLGFRNKLLSFYKLTGNKAFSIYDSLGINFEIPIIPQTLNINN